jgi:putative oxidoreductase
MDVREPHRLLVIYARALVPSVFVGLGLERLLVAVGALDWQGAPITTGALLFSGFELVAGVLIWCGVRVRLVATVLGIFIIVDAFVAHAFWAAAPGTEHGQLLHFLKNFSTLGGLLLLAAVHPSSSSSPGAAPRARENVRLHRPRDSAQGSS